MLAHLTKHQITNLYHFTDVRNLPLIARLGGLLSFDLLEEAHVLDQVTTGGNPLSLSLDRYHGHTDKVHLNFCPKVPMLYRIEPTMHLCYLVLPLEVALREGVIFTDVNAAKVPHSKGEGLRGLNLVDFSAVKDEFAWRKPESRARKQAEILVPDKVELTEIEKVMFRSEASLEEGLRLWPRNVRRPQFRVDTALFNLHRGYVIRAFLTDREVNGDNVAQIQAKSVTRFTEERSTEVTIVVELFATPAQQARVIWHSPLGDYEQVYQFPSTNNYWHWASRNLDTLGIGNRSVEYYLDEVHQFRIPFEVV